MHSYRRDIDGLRAVAVICVVLFHAGVPGFGGGFLGVDVFFVISGFLITGVLLTRTPSVASLLWFYERRIRRIAPALVLVLVASSLAAFVILSPFELQGYARTVVSATVFASNFDFMLLGNYFGITAQELPLQHLWSLAVEEQFYLIFPLVLWGLLRRPKKTVWIALGLVFAFSLAYSTLAAGMRPTQAFYSPASRAWELLLGALVALRPLPSVGPNRWSAVLSVAALAAILVPVAFYSSTTTWPGLHAAIPCLGTAILLALHGNFRTPAAWLLRLKPLSFIGLISYSLYLWHWPVFIFYGRYVLRTITAAEYAIQIEKHGIAGWRLGQENAVCGGGTVAAQPAKREIAIGTPLVFDMAWRRGNEPRRRQAERCRLKGRIGQRPSLRAIGVGMRQQRFGLGKRNLLQRAIDQHHAGACWHRRGRGLLRTLTAG